MNPREKKAQPATSLPVPEPHQPGETTPVKDAQLAPKQPHERDESAGSQSGTPTDMTRQAHADVERGLVDTSRALATDKTYERNLRSEPQGADGERKDDPDQKTR